MRPEYDFSGGVRGKHAKKRVRIIGDNARTNLKSSEELVDVIDRFLETKEIIVSWVFEDTEGYVYKSVPGTVVSNGTSISLRFELVEKNGDDENFEVIIRKTNGSFHLKSDHPAMEDHEYELKEYVAADELVFYLHDDRNRAYFHLR